MNVTEFDTGQFVQTLDEQDKAYQQETGSGPRPGGLHVSHIITDMLQTVEPDRYKKGEALPTLKISAGLSFERELERILLKSLPGGFRPPPIKVDGIWMSPDNVAPEPWRGREFKLSWYSLKSKPCPHHDVYWPWLVQMKAYGKGLETQIFELWGFFVNGEYQPPAPILKAWVLDFTEQEIEENWAMLVNHAKHRGWL